MHKTDDEEQLRKVFTGIHLLNPAIDAFESSNQDNPSTSYKTLEWTPKVRLERMANNLGLNAEHKRDHFFVGYRFGASEI